MGNKNRIKERRKSVPEDIKIQVDKSMSAVKEIYMILDRKNISQKELADRLGKNESEISKWLSGTHNFTFNTISKIEAVLGEKIMITPSEAEPIILYFNPITVQQEATFTIPIHKEAMKRAIRKSLQANNTESANEISMTIDECSILN